MSRFAPKDYAEAKEVADSRVRKPRTPLARGKALGQGQRASGLAGPKQPRLGCARKKTKKLTTGQLKKKAWTEFSIYIRTRRANDQGMTKCCTCSVIKHWKEMQAGHFLRGRLNSNLFDERGCNEQCYGCNVGRDGNVVEYYEWMLVHHGKAVIDELRAKNNVTHKWEPGELQGLLDRYKMLNAANPVVKCESP